MYTLHTVDPNTIGCRAMRESKALKKWSLNIYYPSVVIFVR